MGDFIKVVITLSITFGIAVLIANHENDKWEKFSVEHTCKVVGKTAPEVSIGYVGGTGNGIVTTTTPGKTGWLCNDGVTYWR